MVIWIKVRMKKFCANESQKQKWICFLVRKMPNHVKRPLLFDMPQIRDNFISGLFWVTCCKSWSPQYIQVCLNNKLSDQYVHRVTLIHDWFVRNRVIWTVHCLHLIHQCIHDERPHEWNEKLGEAQDLM